MPSIEITAKSLEEAKAQAAEKLGVPASQVKLTVLEESKGLFGKVNLRVQAEAPEPKPAKAPKAAPKAKAKPVEEPVAEVAEPVVAEVSAPPAEPKRKGLFGKAKPTEAVAKFESKPEPKAEAKPKAATKPAKDEAESEAAPAAVATEADGKWFVETLQRLAANGDLDVKAKVTEVSGKYVNVQLDGRDVAYLVGKHGEVLNALQYLVNIISTQQRGNGVRVTLDGNDYRTRREQALEKLAHSIAEQVKSRGEEAVLDALPAFERRIVHKVLAGFEGVHTYSEGEEPNRRVVIAPAE